MRSAFVAFALVAWAGFSSEALAQSFEQVWAMDAAALQEVPDQDLCTAVAVARDRNLDFPAVAQEARRRSADCSSAIQTLLGECAPLSLERHEPVPGRGHAFFVRNDARHAIRFRINYQGIASTAFVIGPNRTQGFGVQTPGAVAGLGRLLNRNNELANVVQFYDCGAQRY
jgi:hypothetical protein